MKVGLVLYYGPTDNIAPAVAALAKKFPKPFSFFPLMGRRRSDETREETNKEIAEWCRDLDVVLWWHFDVRRSELITIKQASPSCRHVLFNWDEPYTWTMRNDWGETVQLIDGVVTTCKETLDRYRALGVACCTVAYPGYSVWSPNDDVAGVEHARNMASFAYTNDYASLTSYPHQTINRQHFISTLEELVLFPGTISFAQTLLLFKISAMNACTHVSNKFSGYLNERVSNVLGNTGLLWVDNVVGLEDMLIDGWSCVVMQRDLLALQVAHVKKNKFFYDRIRNTGQYVAQQCLTWDAWATRVASVLDPVKGASSSETLPIVGLSNKQIATKIVQVNVLVNDSSFSMHVLDQDVYKNNKDEKRDLISAVIEREGAWEPLEGLLVHLWLSAHGTARNSRFIDIGGHLGYYSLLATRVSKVSRVTYVERNSLYHSVFQKSRVAHDGITALSCELPVAESLAEDLLLLDASETISLIKIDIEGAEPKVMAYLRTLWHRTKALLVEVSPSFCPIAHYATELAYLEELGFVFYDVGCDAQLASNAGSLRTWVDVLVDCKVFTSVADFVLSMQDRHQTNLFCVSKQLQLPACSTTRIT